MSDFIKCWMCGKWYKKCWMCGKWYKWYLMTTANQMACPKCVKKIEAEANS